jgi:hypothetical protein
MLGIWKRGAKYFRGKDALVLIQTCTVTKRSQAYGDCARARGNVCASWSLNHEGLTLFTTKIDTDTGTVTRNLGTVVCPFSAH